MRGRTETRAGRIFAAFAVCCVQFLSGCILHSEHPDPAIVIPPKYDEARGNPDAALPPPDWWRGFHSSELSTLIEQAQGGNFDIAVAVAQIMQADAQATIAGAPLWPNLTLNGSAQRSREAVAAISSGSAGISGSPVSSLYSTSLSASYIVDFWGKNRAALFSAEENALASRYATEVVALTTITTVANTYFQVLAAQDRLRIARNNLTAANRILDLTKQQLSAGTTSQLEVSQQESVVETLRATIPPLEEARKQNIAALAVLVGLPSEHFKVRGGSMERVRLPRVTPGLPSDLLYQRPDIRQAEQQLRSSNFSVEAAKAAFFPTIQLTGQTGFQSLALKSLFGPGAWFYTMAASLAQPIFDGFLLKGQLDQARGVQIQYLQTYRKSIVSAFADVEKALIAIQQTTLQERYQRAAVRAARTAFTLAEERFRGGTISLVTVLQTEQTLFTAEDTLAQIQLARLQAYVSLYQALGGGWPLP